MVLAASAYHVRKYHLGVYLGVRDSVLELCILNISTTQDVGTFCSLFTE